MINKNRIQTALLPERELSYAILRPDICKSTLLWLHGYKERSEELLADPLFKQLAEQYQAAIAFPDVPDAYYLDQWWNDCYTEAFLVREFLPHIAEQYRLPMDRNSLFLGGISMGGFGSLLVGAHNPHLFGKIACISGAFILDDVTMGNPEVVGSLSNISHFKKLFGDIPTLAEDISRNPLRAIEAMENKQTLPPVFLSCGRADLLYQRNAKLYYRLRDLSLDVSWYEAHGDHNWEFFRPAIVHAFRWLYAE